MPLVKLTDLEGRDRYIKLAEVDILDMYVKTEDGEEFTFIDCGNYREYKVRETPERVLEILREPRIPPIKMGEPLA